MANTVELWESDAEARLLENRINGFWNIDYFRNVLLPLLNLKAGDKVLDVGAGNGALTLLLARHLPDIRFIGVDITTALVEDAQQQAQKLGINNVEFREADALQLPFEDGCFDATVCQTLLIHLGEPAKAVTEMSRVLKQGGVFMAAEFHTLNAEWPITAEPAELMDEKALQNAMYMQMIIKGYRQLGQGNLKVGGQVPFLAINAGLRILDIRINDRVSHAFPPYRKPAEQAALAELQSWGSVFQDPAYRAWISNAMVAGGGSENDIADFLSILDNRQQTFTGAANSNYAFVWLINPVLLVTIARKE